MRQFSPSRAFTLVEVVVAVGIAAIVATVCASSFIALQRGFGYCTTWMEVRTNQVRVIDSLAQDLRNARTISLTGSTFPLTMQIPMRYSNYETTGDRAGEPLTSATRVDGKISRSTRFAYSSVGYMTVTYTLVATGSGRQVRRAASWTPVGGAAQNVSRSIADFNNGVTISFANLSGNPLSSPVNLATDIGVVTTVNATLGDNQNRQDFIKTISDTVYLRTLAVR